jgi:hypothetical protein
MKVTKRILAVAVAAGLSTVLAAHPAAAAPGDLTVTGGALAFQGTAPTVGTFTGITLNGTDQLTSAAIPTFTVVDPTGSGAGWNVALSFTDLSNGAATILASGISMLAPVVSAAGGLLTGVTGSAIASVNNAAPNKFVVATATNGGGTYLVSPGFLKLLVPAGTATGTYTTTATIAVTSGP